MDGEKKEGESDDETAQQFGRKSQSGTTLSLPPSPTRSSSQCEREKATEAIEIGAAEFLA